MILCHRCWQQLKHKRTQGPPLFDPTRLYHVFLSVFVQWQEYKYLSNCLKISKQLSFDCIQNDFMLLECKISRIKSYIMFHFQVHEYPKKQTLTNMNLLILNKNRKLSIISTTSTHSYASTPPTWLDCR